MIHSMSLRRIAIHCTSSPKKERIGWISTESPFSNYRRALPGNETYAFDEGLQKRSFDNHGIRSPVENLMKLDIGEKVVPIIPDEGRTFGMDPLFSEFGIYSSFGQL